MIGDRRVSFSGGDAAATPAATPAAAAAAAGVAQADGMGCETSSSQAVVNSGPCICNTATTTTKNSGQGPPTTSLSHPPSTSLGSDDADAVGGAALESRTVRTKTTTACCDNSSSDSSSGLRRGQLGATGGGGLIRLRQRLLHLPRGVGGSPNNNLHHHPRTSTGSSTTSSWNNAQRRAGSQRGPLRPHPSAQTGSRSVLYGRVMFVAVLAGTAAGLGYAAYALLSSSQTATAAVRFDSITARALATASLVVEEKKKATDALALVVGTAHPNASEWPFVHVVGYQEIASSLKIVTQGSLSFCPIVQSGGDEQAAFEDFAYDMYETTLGYPNGTGMSAFGRGIFSYGTGPDDNQTWPDGRFQSVDGWTYHRQDPDDILVPFLQSDFGPHDSLMLNVFFEHNRAKAILDVVKCAAERATTVAVAPSSSPPEEYYGMMMECGTLTDLMWSETAAMGVDPGPAGLMFSPIFPRNDNTTLTGFIVGKQIWHDLLKHGFESDVSGLQVVLRTASNNAHTYRIEKGQAEYEGPGELHDPDARLRRTNYSLLLADSGLFSNYTVEYILDVYSTDAFYVQYQTDEPTIACIGAVMIIAVTSLLFFGYDYFVRKEFHDKKRLLDAKRTFVRFVSHEVRTPLNTVCMGLTLLQHDLQAALNRNNVAGGGDDGSAGNGPSLHATTTGTRSDPVVGTLQDAKMVAQIEEWKELSNQVYENANAAVNVLSDLLNYDKIQMGTLKLDLSLIPIWNTLERTVAEFKIAAIEKKVSLVLDFGPLVAEADDDDNEGDLESPKNNKPGTGGTVNSVSGLPRSLSKCKIVGDNVRFAQVLRNLISNGLKFSKVDGDLTIRVSERRASKRRLGKQKETIALHKNEEVELSNRGSVVIEVIDDGVGMTPNQVKVVFDDGTQFNANELQAGGGSGLGLNIAKGIVDQHGGKLSCSSEGLGHGSTFVLSLPLYDNDNDDDSGNVDGQYSESKPRSDGSGEEIVGSLSPSARHECGRLKEDAEYVIPKFNILVVDDALTNRKLCMRLLEKSGHTCAGACDGVEGVDMVRQAQESGRPYDCILLDYEMPNMKGPAACEEMRRMGCSAFIAGVTGNLMTEDVDHFRNSGADWVLAKPFRLEALEQLWIENDVTPFNNIDGEENRVIRVSSSTQLEGMDDDLARSLKEHDIVCSNPTSSET